MACPLSSLIKQNCACAKALRNSKHEHFFSVAAPQVRLTIATSQKLALLLLLVPLLLLLLLHSSTSAADNVCGIQH